MSLKLERIIKALDKLSDEDVLEFEKVFTSRVKEVKSKSRGHNGKVLRDYNSIPWSEYFEYDETSPSCLRWKSFPQSWSKYRVGDVAGKVGYRKKDKKPQGWALGLFGEMWAVHRIIWCIKHGSIPKELLVDHLDRDCLNNKIDNLRLVTHAENNLNKEQAGKKDPRLIAGVYWVGKNLTACWNENGKQYHKNFARSKYETEEELIAAAITFRLEKLEYLRSLGLKYSEDHGQNKSKY